MKRKALYRTAAILAFLFAAGHTSGVLSTDKLPPAAQAMRAAMFEKHFNFMGADSSFGGFYVGFGLAVTLFLLFTAWMAWSLGGLSGASARDARPLAWGLGATFLVNAVLAYRYFFAGPVILSLLIALCIGLAEWRGGRGTA